MSDIDNTINTLRDQVEALQYDLEQATEANKEWHELMNDHSVEEINELVTFAQDYDMDQVTDFVQNYDIDDIVRALKYESIDELRAAFDKIDEYGDPEEMAEKVERLEEELQEAHDSAKEFGSNDSVARVDYESEVKIRQHTQGMLNSTQNLLDATLSERDALQERLDSNVELLQGQDVHIVELKTTVARIENEYNALDQMYTTVTDALSLQQADYKQLAEYHERVCRECDALRAAEPGVYTQAKEETLRQLREKSNANFHLNLQVGALQKAYKDLSALYFAEVSGFDDVPSSKPERDYLAELFGPKSNDKDD